MTQKLEILNQSDEQIFEVIGKHFSDQDLGVRPPSKDEMISTGKKWAEATRTEIKSKLCKSPLIKYLIKKEEADLVKIYAGIVASLMLLGLFDLGELGSEDALYAYAAYLTKEGLDNLCCESNNKNET